MAPHKGKVAVDNAAAFNVSVTEYKLKPCEKILAEIEKIVGVLSKVRVEEKIIIIHENNNQ